MISQIEIFPLQKQDVPQITHLQPDGWNDIREVFYKFIDHDFFYPIKAIFNGRIIGLGEVIFTKNTAWIGNIIVENSFRNQGLGTYLTQFLSNHIIAKNIPSQLLLATPMGKPVYDKLGFIHDSDYVFMKRDTHQEPLKLDVNRKAIQPYDSGFYKQVVALDELAMGENREAILHHFTEDAMLFVEHDVQGFFLPHLGDGLIVAKNNHIGFELLKFKWTHHGETITLPAQNHETIRFAESFGFKPYRYAARMILGTSFAWNPQMIYNRIGGYLG